MMNLYNAMAMKGASRQQLESNTYKLAEQCIAEDAGLIDDTARHEAEKLIGTINKARAALDSSISEAKKLGAEIEYKAGEAERVIARAESTTVKDPTLMDAVKAFRMVLENASDVLGEETIRTPEVACEALREAGYVAWRGIMGPKDNSDSWPMPMRR